MRSAHPVELLLLAVLLVAESVAVLVAAGVALAQVIPTAAPAPAVVSAPVPDLAALPVRELRQLARCAGYRQLARSGRRADLLSVLAATG